MDAVLEYRQAEAAWNQFRPLAVSVVVAYTQSKERVPQDFSSSLLRARDSFKVLMDNYNSKTGLNVTFDNVDAALFQVAETGDEAVAELVLLPALGIVWGAVSAVGVLSLKAMSTKLGLSLLAIAIGGSLVAVAASAAFRNFRNSITEGFRQIQKFMDEASPPVRGLLVMLLYGLGVTGMIFLGVIGYSLAKPLISSRRKSLRRAFR